MSERDSTAEQPAAASEVAGEVDQAINEPLVAVEAVADTDESADEPWWASSEVFEFWATILIGLAAVATAWAGFESSKWSGVQASNFSQAGAARTESVRFSTLAGQQASIDVTTFINWLNNYVADVEQGEIEPVAPGEIYEPTPGTPSGFFFERFRPEFAPAVNAWLETQPINNPDAPSTPFVMDEYQLEAEARSVELAAEATQHTADAATANQNSDNYVVTAVLFATALFFAALASRLGAPRYRYASLIVATLMFAGTLVYILTQPIEI